MDNKSREKIIKKAFNTSDINSLNEEVSREKAQEIAHKIFVSLVNNVSIEILDNIDKL